MKKIMKHTGDLIDQNEKKISRYQYIIFFAVFIIVFVAIVIVRLKGVILPYATHRENNDEVQFIRNFTENLILEQEFSSPHAFDCLTVSCSNHDMNLGGRTIFEVYDKNQKILTAYKEVENTDIYYGKPVIVDFEEEMAANETYLLKITAKDTSKDAIGVYGYTPTSESEEATAVINGKNSEYVLSIGTHTYTELYYILTILSFVCITCGFGLFCWWIKKEIYSVEKVFLFLCFPMAMSLLCFLSVNFINDGDAHFARAYHYANVILNTAEDDTEDTISMRKDDIDALFDSTCMNAKNAQNMFHIYENWNWFVKEPVMVSSVKWRSAGTTNAFVYLPSVFAIVLSRVIGLGTYPMIYLAKIFSLSCYLGIIYIAIKITPIGKHILLFLAVLPISIQQAVGITYDTMTTAVVFAYLSVILKVYFDKVNAKWYGLLAILGVMLGICKGGIYTPLLFLLLFLPTNKFGGKKRKISFVIIIMILTFGIMMINYKNVIIPYICSKNPVAIEMEKAITENNTIVTARYGINYIFSNPLGFGKLLINTFLDNFGLYLGGLLGSKVAWAVEELPVWSYILYGIVLVLAKNGVNEKEVVDTKLRIGLIGGAVLVVGAFCGLFLMETPLGYSYIRGIQGRYFIPVIFLMLIAWRNNAVKQEKGTEKFLYVACYVSEFFFLLAYLELFMKQTYY